jgi:hypothetical protein
MTSKIGKTVKNTATQIRGFCTLEAALIVVGWIAFAIGIYVIEDPLWKLIILAVSRVLP